jgi:hypothetical protein
MTTPAKTVRLAFELTDEQALNLAQFLKRVGFSDFRAKAQFDAEAYDMQEAASQVAEALARVGYAPR